MGDDSELVIVNQTSFSSSPKRLVTPCPKVNGSERWGSPVSCFGAGAWWDGVGQDLEFAGGGVFGRLDIIYATYDIILHCITYTF